MPEPGILYLIPCAIGDEAIDHAIPAHNREIVNGVTEFIVENVRTARRFLLKAGLTSPIDQLTFHLLNEHVDERDITSYLDGAVQGKNIGLLSEAGCPGIADPGAAVVRLAHQKHIRVIPLVGPSSIFLALMASGLNGQQFSFHGYLPKQKVERISKLRQLEANSKRDNSTQIFIEAPYRNEPLLKDILETCNPGTLLCIAADISQESESIYTCTVSEWRRRQIKLNDRPTVFLIGSSLR